MADATASDFEFVKELPTRKVRKGVLELAREFAAISQRQGGLIPQAMAATVLGVSRQRINQLVKEGTFSVWTFYGRPWLSQAEIVDFARLRRGEGENQHKPSVKELWRASYAAGREFVEAAQSK